jgi:hypothetical protein
MKQLCRVSILLISLFLLSSCVFSDSGSKGYLKLVNNTNASITVTWGDNSHSIIEANTSKKFSFPTKSAITDAKVVSQTYTCVGIYLHEATFTDLVTAGQTVVRALDPNSGGINFINNTTGQISVESSGLMDPAIIDSMSNSTQSWLLNGPSASVTVTLSGDMVFVYNVHINVFLNATSTYEVNPTGAAIRVKNNSSTNIMEVYLKHHEELVWGGNDLQVIIAPGHSVTWTANPNYWDVKVVDLQGLTETWENNSYIDINQMLIIGYPHTK